MEERGGLARWKDIDSKRARRRGEREEERDGERERQRKGNRGAFHVTTIINGYIPTSSHEAIFQRRIKERGRNERATEREREMSGERI